MTLPPDFCTIAGCHRESLSRYSQVVRLREAARADRAVILTGASSTATTAAPGLDRDDDAVPAVRARRDGARPVPRHRTDGLAIDPLHSLVACVQGHCSGDHRSHGRTPRSSSRRSAALAAACRRVRASVRAGTARGAGRAVRRRGGGESAYTLYTVHVYMFSQSDLVVTRLVCCTGTLVRATW
eukprot:COSAG02_NODE_2328_length_9122_cov_7.787100_1_plen_184_part_00